MDNFESDFKQVQQHCTRLANQMENIRAAKDSQNATSPAAQKYLMKQSYNKMHESMQHFDKLVYDYENNPSNFKNLSKKEINFRINRINNLKAEAEGLSNVYKQLENETLQ